MNIENMYWTEDSFGSGPVPSNWGEVCSEANNLIDEYADRNPEDEDSLMLYCERLWESFCGTDKVGNVIAEFDA